MWPPPWWRVVIRPVEFRPPFLVSFPVSAFSGFDFVTSAKSETVRNVLVVTEHDDELSWKSLRNVPFVHLLAEDQLNTYDVLASDYVVFTKAALDAFVERGSE